MVVDQEKAKARNSFYFVYIFLHITPILEHPDLVTGKFWGKIDGVGCIEQPRPFFSCVMFMRQGEVILYMSLCFYK